MTLASISVVFTCSQAFHILGKTSYNCARTAYGQITRTKLLKVCNIKACSELLSKWIKSIKRKRVPHQEVPRENTWQESYEGNYQGDFL